MTTQPSARWPDVEAHIAARLAAKAWNQADLVRESGLSAEGVRPVMKGVPGNYRAGTLAKISKALGWTGDSISLILEGREPVLDGADADLADRLKAIEERQERANQLMEEILRRLPPAADDR